MKKAFILLLLFNTLQYCRAQDSVLGNNSATKTSLIYKMLQGNWHYADDRWDWKISFKGKKVKSITKYHSKCDTNVCEYIVQYIDILRLQNDNAYWIKIEEQKGDIDVNFNNGYYILGYCMDNAVVSISKKYLLLSPDGRFSKQSGLLVLKKE